MTGRRQISVSYLLGRGHGGLALGHHVEEERPDERTADVLPRPHPPDGEQKGDVTQHPRYKNQCPQLQMTHNGNTALSRESGQAAFSVQKKEEEEEKKRAD